MKEQKKKWDTKYDSINNDYVDILPMKDEFVLWTVNCF